MLERTSQADRVCTAGAVVTILALFLPWFHIDDPGARVTVNGFRSGIPGAVLFLAAAAVVALVLARHDVLHLGTRRPDHSTALTAAVAAAAGALVLQLLVGSSGSHATSLGVLPALAGVVAMAAGAWLERRYPRGAGSGRHMQHR